MVTLADLFASRFISRPDVIAVQLDNGAYNPLSTQITRELLDAHLKGEATYGHYMINPADNSCKFFCFDIDLKTDGFYWVEPDLALAPMGVEESNAWYEANRSGPHPINPRESWKNRDQQPRQFFKTQFRTISELFTYQIGKLLDIPAITSYSGHKGIHVYGMTGSDSAENIRAAADYVLSEIGIFTPTKGNNFFGDASGEFPNLEIEVFPKQTTVDSGHYGNLLRLDLGINRKSPADACFFLDQTLPHTMFAPHRNPEWLLTHLTPYADYPSYQVA